ncbi:hypothetical protein RE6C_02842 [Rhodopirellula europaea 6C]|uniref:Uncharacterized protein n=1 Tax=Rhodopirellula europaea 6C TaxID=1263867 RepID=M2AUX0_9BACT|nr:hypothetical protein RE6C_02842 [Rhodopirellula europaea 6C]
MMVQGAGKSFELHQRERNEVDRSVVIVKEAPKLAGEFLDWSLPAERYRRSLDQEIRRRAFLLVIQP